MKIFMRFARAIARALAKRVAQRRAGASPSDLGSVSHRWIAEHRLAETHDARQ
jgi:hypothetical protein